MKVFDTTHALTQGIIEREATACPESSTDMVEVKTGMYNMYLHGEGRDWHRTHEAAVAKAEAMRKKKVVSLHKSLKKLESLKFS